MLNIYKNASINLAALNKRVVGPSSCLGLILSPLLRVLFSNPGFKIAFLIMSKSTKYITKENNKKYGAKIITILGMKVINLLKELKNIRKVAKSTPLKKDGIIKKLCLMKLSPIKIATNEIKKYANSAGVPNVPLISRL